MTLSTSIPLRRDPAAEPGADAAPEFSGLAALGLLLVFAVFALAWWRKRAAGKAGLPTGLPQWLGAKRNASIQTQATTHLTPRHSLHEVHWQGQRLLIGCTEQTISLVAQAPLAATANPQPPLNVHTDSSPPSA